MPEVKITSREMIASLELCISILPQAKKTLRDSEREHTEKVLRSTIHMLRWLDEKRHSIAAFLAAEHKEANS